jgi:hypothetical protein
MQKGNEGAVAVVGVRHRIEGFLLDWVDCHSHKYLYRSDHKELGQPASRHRPPGVNYLETTVALVRELEHP